MAGAVLLLTGGSFGVELPPEHMRGFQGADCFVKVRLVSLHVFILAL